MIACDVLPVAMFFKRSCYFAILITLAYSGNFGLFLPFWAILVVLGYFGCFGLFWSFWHENGCTSPGIFKGGYYLRGGFVITRNCGIWRPQAETLPNGA